MLQKSKVLKRYDGISHPIFISFIYTVQSEKTRCKLVVDKILFLIIIFILNLSAFIIFIYQFIVSEFNNKKLSLSIYNPKINDPFIIIIFVVIGILGNMPIRRTRDLIKIKK